MKLYITLTLLFFIVIISGCTNTHNTVGGVVIKEFTPDIKNIEIGERFNINAMIQNIGDVDAKKVTLELLNVDEKWGCRKECKDVDILHGVDRERNIDGETYTCSWKCKIPEQEEYIRLTYRPILRVGYQYKTILTKTISLISRTDEINENYNIKTNTIKTTNSPIKIEIQTKEKIRRIKNKIEIPVHIRILNNGDGTACLDDCSEKTNRNRVNVYMEGHGINTDTCKKDVYLWDGKEGSLTCVLEMGTNNNINILNKHLTIIAEYGYFVDGETEIVVKKI